MGAKSFFEESKRVFRITKRPDREEFNTIVKASALGIAVIGLIGFVIFILNQLLRGA